MYSGLKQNATVQFFLKSDNCRKCVLNYAYTTANYHKISNLNLCKIKKKKRNKIRLVFSSNLLSSFIFFLYSFYYTFCLKLDLFYVKINRPTNKYP